MSYDSRHEQEMERARNAAREGKESFNSNSGSVKNQYAANEEFSRQKRFEEQQNTSRRNNEDFFDMVNSADINPYQYPSKPSAPTGPMTKLQAILSSIGFAFLIFVCISIFRNWWEPSSQRERRIDPTSVGKENYILATKESIFIFNSPTQNGIGYIRKGIPADSINNFLKNIDLSNAKINMQSGKKTFLKKIPSSWVVLNSGKRFTGGAWLFLDDLVDFTRIPPNKP